MNMGKILKTGLFRDDMMFDILAIERIMNNSSIHTDRRMLSHYIKEIINDTEYPFLDNIRTEIYWTCDDISINGYTIDVNHFEHLMKSSKDFFYKLHILTKPVFISYMFSEMCSSHNIFLTADEIANTVKPDYLKEYIIEILKDWSRNCEISVKLSIDITSLKDADINSVKIHSIKKRCLRCGKTFFYNIDIMNGEEYESI